VDGQGERLNFDLGTAAGLRGAGVFGIVVGLLVVAGGVVAPPLGALLVFLWVWLSRAPFADIGLKRPGSWLGAIAVGVVAGVALKLLMKAVVMPYAGAPDSGLIYQHVRSDLNAFLIEVPQMIVLAGFAEEVVFRGFFINRLTALFGSSIASSIAMVAVTAAVFGPIHYVAQGFFGALQATIVGVLFATIYLLNGRRLWALVFAHGAFDVCALYLIYSGLEQRVADAVFP